MISIEKILYTGHTCTTVGRDGAGRSHDGRLDLKLSPPGAPGTGTNPEQLFAIGWSASFIGALRHGCNARKIAFPADTAVDAQVDLVHGEQGFFLRARLAVSLPGLEDDLANELIEAARHNCPYSKAMRGGLEMAVTLV
jgi:lipoyl-dependent peroxiredoxin